MPWQLLLHIKGSGETITSQINGDISLLIVTPAAIERTVFDNASSGRCRNAGKEHDDSNRARRHLFP